MLTRIWLLFKFFFSLLNCRYWAAIDDGLRQAAFGRGVRVRLMASQWANTRSDMHQYLLSLAALNGIEANYQYNVSIEVVSWHSSGMCACVLDYLFIAMHF